MAESSLKGLKALEKGEIAWNEQFLIFPQCFQKTCKTKGLFQKG